MQRVSAPDVQSHRDCIHRQLAVLFMASTSPRPSRCRLSSLSLHHRPTGCVIVFNTFSTVSSASRSTECFSRKRIAPRVQTWRSLVAASSSSSSASARIRFDHLAPAACRDIKAVQWMRHRDRGGAWERGRPAHLLASCSCSVRARAAAWCAGTRRVAPQPPVAEGLRVGNAPSCAGRACVRRDGRCFDSETIGDSCTPSIGRRPSTTNEVRDDTVEYRAVYTNVSQYRTRRRLLPTAWPARSNRARVERGPHDGGRIYNYTYRRCTGKSIAVTPLYIPSTVQR